MAVLAIVFLVVFVVATLLTLGFIVVVWVYREIAYRHTPSDPSDAMRLSASERSELSELKHRLADTREHIESTFRRGAALQRRKDGYFYASSRLGSELNAQLRPAIEREERLAKRVSEIEAIPRERFERWSESKSKLSGSRFAAAWFSIAMVVFLVWRPLLLIAAGVTPLLLLLSLPYLGEGETPLDQIIPEWVLVAYGTSVVATWFALGVYHLRRVLVAKSHERLFENRSANGTWLDAARAFFARVFGVVRKRVKRTGNGVRRKRR